MGRQLSAGVVMSAALRATRVPELRSKHSKAIGAVCAEAAVALKREEPASVIAERTLSEAFMVERCVRGHWFGCIHTISGLKIEGDERDLSDL